MFKAYVASFRLAISLVCLGASLIIGGVWLGLVPNESAIDLQQRQQQCHQIALTAASLIRDGHWDTLTSILQDIVDEDDGLLAVEIDTEPHQMSVVDGRTSAATAPKTTDPAAAPAYDLPWTLALKVDDEILGTIDFYHRQQIASGWQILASHPLVRLLAFFVVAGVTVYTIFVVRLIKSFEVTQVVPDRVRQALDTLSEGLLVLDERERIVLANRSFSSTVGLSQESLLGRNASSLPWICNESAGGNDYPWVWAIEESEPRTQQLMQLRLANGDVRIFSINVSPIEPSESRTRGALATFRDVTQFERYRAQLEHRLARLRYSRDEISSKNRELEILATQDALTGCLNRRALFDRLTAFWPQPIQQQHPIACLMVDNDRFKRINDTYGHHVGDQVLRQVSSVLTSTFPEPSLVCRYGGEEFCVIVPGATAGQAVDQAESARAKIESIRLHGFAKLRITVSIGVSGLEYGANDPQELINQADECMYVAKRAGRNQVVAYSRSAAQTLTRDSGPKQNATQIGMHIERLADALDARDVDALQTLAAGLRAMARHHRVESMAVGAENIDTGGAQENTRWIRLLGDAKLLIDLCQVPENAFLDGSEKS